MKNHLKFDYMKKFGLEGSITKKIIGLLERQEEDYKQFLSVCSIEKV
jgi:hypothetical protein